MASLEKDACTNYPDFAVIWSFIENFGDKLNVTLPNISELQCLLENSEEVGLLLVQIIAYLLRRINKSIKLDKWEKGLQKFVHSYSHEDGWELEHSGFMKAKLEVKIRVLKNLFEKQFDLHKSFKEKVNLLTAKQLRLQPCGRDKQGVSYWCQKDEFANLRIYKDDQDEETWSMVAKSREELVSLIEKLQAQIPQKIKRETSVEESQSETTTPMILSRAPTPIDSAIHTPVLSSRSSPVPETVPVPIMKTVEPPLIDSVTSLVIETVAQPVTEIVVDSSLNIDNQNETTEPLANMVVASPVGDPIIENVTASPVKEINCASIEDSATAPLLPKTVSVPIEMYDNDSLQEIQSTFIKETPTVEKESSSGPTDKEKDYKSRVKEKELVNTSSTVEDQEKASYVQREDVPIEVKEQHNISKESMSVNENNSLKQDLDRNESKIVLKDNISQKSKLEKIIDKFAAKTASDASKVVNMKGRVGTHLENTEKASLHPAEKSTNNNPLIVPSPNTIGPSVDLLDSDNIDVKVKSQEKNFKNESNVDITISRVKDMETAQIKEIIEAKDHTAGSKKDLEINLNAEKEINSESNPDEGGRNRNKLTIDEESLNDMETKSKISMQNCKTVPPIVSEGNGKEATIHQNHIDVTAAVTERSSQKDVITGRKVTLSVEKVEVPYNEELGQKKIQRGNVIIERAISSLPIIKGNVLSEKQDSLKVMHSNLVKPVEGIASKENIVKFSSEKVSQSTDILKTETLPKTDKPLESPLVSSAVRKDNLEANLKTLEEDKDNIEMSKEKIENSDVNLVEMPLKNANLEFNKEEIDMENSKKVEKEIKLEASKHEIKMNENLETVNAEIKADKLLTNTEGIAASKINAEPLQEKEECKVEVTKKEIEDKLASNTENLDKKEMNISNLEARGDYERKNVEKNKKLSEVNIKAVEKKEFIVKEMESRCIKLKMKNKQDNLDIKANDSILQNKETIKLTLEKSYENSSLKKVCNVKETEKADLNIGKALGIQECSKPLSGNEEKNVNVSSKEPIETEESQTVHKKLNITEILPKNNCETLSSSELNMEELAASPKNQQSQMLNESKENLQSKDATNVITDLGKISAVSQKCPKLLSDSKELSADPIINLGKEKNDNSSLSEIIPEKQGSSKLIPVDTDITASFDNVKDETVVSSNKSDSNEGQITKVTSINIKNLETDKELCSEMPPADAVDMKSHTEYATPKNIENTIKICCNESSCSKSADGKSGEVHDFSNKKENMSGIEKKSAICENENDLSLADDTIEEPVMIVKGNGEGALCDSKNPFTSLGNWWENFENNIDQPEMEISENVKYFWGNGSGVDCDAGNSGDEGENVTESKAVSGTSPDVVNLASSTEHGNLSDDEEKKVNGIKCGGIITENTSLQTESSGVNNKGTSNDVSLENETLKDNKNESQKGDAVHTSNQNCNDVDAKLSHKDNNKIKGRKFSSKDEFKSDQSEQSEPERQTRTTRSRGRPKKVRSTVVSESDDETVEQYISLKKPSKANAEAPRQRSARIAKIREREETERRELEAMRMKQLSDENKVKEFKKKARNERRSMRAIRKDKKEKKKDKSKKRKKKKKKGKVKAGNIEPWAHSSSSASSSSEEEEIMEMEDEENEELVFKSDHEFSPESDIGEEDAQPIKRARTAIKVKTEERPVKEEVTEKVEESDSFDDTKCAKCEHQDHPETILLCDLCDAGWHLSCLRPPLLSVPEGDWTCPSCEHLALIEKLKEILDEYDCIKKRAENEELRRQRLAYINVSLDNVLPEKRKKTDDFDSDSDSDSDDESDSDETGSESSSSSDNGSSDSGPLYTLRARPSRTSKEHVEDFDELIDEAIRGEIEAAKEVQKSRGKDIDCQVVPSLGHGKDIDGHSTASVGHSKDVDSCTVANVGRGKDIANIMHGEKEDDLSEEEREDVADEEEYLEVENTKEGSTTSAVELPVDSEITESKHSKEEEEEEVLVTNKRKRDADDESDEESKDDESVSGNRSRSAMMAASKKKRRLTDLDAFEDEDDSDEDFKGSSADESDEEDESAALSSSFNTESESNDSDRRSKRRYDSQPLRRSSRNRRNLPSDYDSEPEKMLKRGSAARKRRRDETTSEDEDDDEYSSGSGSDSYSRHKQKRKSRPRQAAKKGKKKGRGKKKGGSKGTNKKKKKKLSQGEKGETKPRPRIRYSKPKNEETPVEMEGKRRVTRGRQINFCDTLFISEEEEEEEDEKPKSRGKVMKGERHQPDSSDYEESDDERKKRRGVSGGLGKGKVMKDDDDDSDYEVTPRKSITPVRRPSSSNNSEGVQSEQPKQSPIRSTEDERGSPAIKNPSVVNVAACNTPPVSHGVESLIGGRPDFSKRPMPDQRSRAEFESKMYPNAGDRGGRLGGEPQIHIASSPVPAPLIAGSSVSITPVSYVPNPNAIQHGGNLSNKRAPHSPLHLPHKIIPPIESLVTGSSKQNSDSQQPVIVGKHTSGLPVGRSSPGPKWVPHVSSNTGPPSRHGMATPPRPNMAPNLNSSPPPPYRSSPIPPAHPSGYSHYPPEHYTTHPGYPPGYAPRHPMGHAIYGPPGSHPGYPQHGGVIRGPPPETLRHPPPNRSSPNHSAHSIVKPGYPGLEPMPYRGSPTPIDASGRHGSPGGAAAGDEPKEIEGKPSAAERGEFSSGLMSYFSSQREDVE